MRTSRPTIHARVWLLTVFVTLPGLGLTLPPTTAGDGRWSQDVVALIGACPTQPSVAAASQHRRPETRLPAAAALPRLIPIVAGPAWKLRAANRGRVHLTLARVERSAPRSPPA